MVQNRAKIHSKSRFFQAIGATVLVCFLGLLGVYFGMIAYENDPYDYDSYENRAQMAMFALPYLVIGVCVFSSVILTGIAWKRAIIS